MALRASVIGVAIVLLSASGCTVTRNQVTVAKPADDSVITATIKARYAESKDVPITDITIETLYGVVLLTGSAKNPLQRITAQQVAEKVTGVKAVHNEIIVSP